MSYEPGTQTSSPPYIPPNASPAYPRALPPPKPERSGWKWVGGAMFAAALAGSAMLAGIWVGDRGDPAASAPTIAPAAPTTEAPLYTVAKTWAPEAGLGGGATLVVASESKSQAQAAANQYLRSVEAGGRYVYVEVLGHEDATQWICAGELLASESDLQYAIFDMSEQFVNFPATWIECHDM